MKHTKITLALALVTYINYHVITSAEELSAIESNYCNDYGNSSEISGELPFVQIYDANLYANSNISIFSNSVNFSNVEEGSVFIRFECTHYKPIHWVFEYDDIPTKSESADVSVRGQPNEDTLEKFEFKTWFQLQYSSYTKYLVYSCQEFANPCKRKVVRSFSLEDDLVSFIIVENGNLTEQEQHDLSILNNPPTGSSNNNASSCEISVTLTYDYDTPEGNLNRVLWLIATESSTNIQIQSNPVAVYNSSIYFENAYRSVTPLEQRCLRRQNGTPTCVNCDYDINAISSQLRPFAVEWTLINKVNKVRRVLKGFFTLAHGGEMRRTFHTISDVPPKPEDFLYMEELPEVVYTGDTLQIVCESSNYYFARGTRVKVVYENVTETLERMDPTDDDVTRFGSTLFTFNYTLSHILTPTSKCLTVYCLSPVWRSPEIKWVNKSRLVLVEKLIAPEIILQESYTFLEGESGNVTCSSVGNPRPEVTLTFPKSEIKYSTDVYKNSTFYSVTHIFENVSILESSKYECKATNSRRMQSSKNFTIIVNPGNNPGKLTDNHFSDLLQNSTLNANVSEVVTNESTESNDSKMQFFDLILYSSIGGAGLICLIISILVIHKIRKDRIAFRQLTESAIKEFKHGNRQRTTPKRYTYPVNNSTCDNNSQITRSIVENYSYNSLYEVPYSRWQLYGTLNKGAFSVVTNGTVRLHNETLRISVKSLKPRVDIDNFKSSLMELKILSYLGPHTNVLSLVAACTDKIRIRSIFVGVELCSNGDLFTYIRKRRPIFTDFVIGGELIQRGMSDESNGYCNQGLFTTRTLLKWSFEIANGMEFLESKSVLHLNLAARNVYLNSELTAKIGDFGLYQELYDPSNYTKKTNTPLPWKWMAMESLSSMQFSSKSDVWAYGITLWELFTLGDSPYTGTQWTPDFVNLLSSGMRLNCPSHAPIVIYNLMVDCWRESPEDRPSFPEIKSRLLTIDSSSNLQHPKDSSPTVVNCDFEISLD